MLFTWSVVEWHQTVAGRFTPFRGVFILFDQRVELFPLTMIRLSSIFRRVGR